MFDTIGIRYLNSLPDSYLDKWNIERKDSQSFMHQFSFEGSRITAIYHKWGFNYSSPMLNIYTSLPKLIYGCNHKMLSADDLPETYKILNAFLASIPEFSELSPAEETRLVRLDACYNYNLGPELDNYLHVAKGANISRRQRVVYKTGVQHKSGGDTLSVYDKYAECKHHEAKGLLRVERQLKNKDKVMAVIGKAYPTLKDLNLSLSHRMIQSSLKDLNLDKSVICNLPLSENKVIEAVGRGALSRNIIHYLRDKNSLDYSDLEKIYPSATRRNYERILKEIGINSTAIEEEKILPPLSHC